MAYPIWHIIPLYDSHNKQADELEIEDDTTLVPANVSKICET
jgi:hypothetical protein